MSHWHHREIATYYSDSSGLTCFCSTVDLEPQLFLDHLPLCFLLWLQKRKNTKLCLANCSDSGKDVCYLLKKAEESWGEDSLDTACCVGTRTSVSFQYPHKNQAWRNEFEILVLVKWWQVNSWSCWPASPAKLWGSRFTERPSIKK